MLDIDPTAPAAGNEDAAIEPRVMMLAGSGMPVALRGVSQCDIGCRFAASQAGNVS